MKTKAEIVQRLLEEKKISSEEAVILLMSEHPIIYSIPAAPVYPIVPNWPYPIPSVP